MPSRRNPEANPAPNLTEATERAGLRIRGLQSRLMAMLDEERDGEKDERIREETAEPGAEELERDLQRYFATAMEPAPQLTRLNEMRDRVLDGVVDKILREWEQGTPRALEHELVDRLIQRLLDRLGAPVRL